MRFAVGMPISGFTEHMSIPDATVLALGLIFVVSLVPLLPTEPVLISCGVLAATGHLPLVIVIGVAALGCVLSDLILYTVGRTFGTPVIARLRTRNSAAATLEWVSAKLGKYGELILVVARWLPGGGTIGAVSSGALLFPLRRLFLASIIGCTLWSSYATMLGYWGGELANNDLPLAFVFSLGFAILASVLIGFLSQRLRRKVIGQGVENGEPVGVTA